MRYLVQSKQFKRDLKRIAMSGNRYRNILNKELRDVVKTLANDEPLDYFYQDHALIGKRYGSRECHLAFDFLLVYRYEDDDKLIHERLGTHSEVLGL